MFYWFPTNTSCVPHRGVGLGAQPPSYFFLILGLKPPLFQTNTDSEDKLTRLSFCLHVPKIGNITTVFFLKGSSSNGFLCVQLCHNINDLSNVATVQPSSESKIRESVWHFPQQIKLLSLQGNLISLQGNNDIKEPCHIRVSVHMAVKTLSVHWCEIFSSFGLKAYYRIR